MSNNLKKHTFQCYNTKFYLFHLINEILLFSFFWFPAPLTQNTLFQTPALQRIRRTRKHINELLDTSRILSYSGRERGEHEETHTRKKPSQKEGRAQHKSVYTLELQFTWPHSSAYISAATVFSSGVKRAKSMDACKNRARSFTLMRLCSRKVSIISAVAFVFCSFIISDMPIFFSPLNKIICSITCIWFKIWTHHFPECC